MNESNARIEWIDTARGIALFFVIFGHLKTPYIATWIYTFHIPLFFFLSGCVYRQPRDFKTFMNKKVNGLIIPYFFLGAIIWLFHETLYFVNGPENSLYGNGLTMLWNLIKQQGYWTVWFLACLFVCQMLFYWILRLGRENRYTVLSISITLAIVTFVYYRLGGKTLPWCIDIACIAQLFFTLGYFFNKSTRIKQQFILSRGLKWRMLCLALLFINCVSGFMNIRLTGKSLDMSIGMYGNEVLAILSALSGILFVVMVSTRINSRLLTYLGQNTMIIFGWHSRIIIVALDMLYCHFNLLTNESFIIQLARSLVSFTIILAILIPVTELIKKTRIRKLFGI